MLSGCPDRVLLFSTAKSAKVKVVRKQAGRQLCKEANFLAGDARQVYLDVNALSEAT
jgi:hypothetical protein